MTPEEIKNFQDAVRKAYSNLNIIDFAYRLGFEKVEFENGKPKDAWLCEIWQRFQALSIVTAFDSETLAKILGGENA